MNELQAILDSADSNEGPMYLATVVDVAGSAYRRPGARMLILADGQRVGMISGGCLERDLCRQAASLCKKGPKLISFDTRSDSTNTKGRYNLGCSGLIYILLQRVTQDATCPLNPVREVLSNRTAKVLATVYQAEGDSPYRVGQQLTSEKNDPLASTSLKDTFEQVEKTGVSICCHFVHDEKDSESRLLVEHIKPPKPIWIFGAGDDAIPMARIANELGWAVTVVDDRAENLTATRFPMANRIHSGCVEEISTQLSPSHEVAAVLMTHSFTKDADFLPWLCRAGIGYIGLLGPKVRTGKLIRRMHELKLCPDPESFDRVRTPAGLDIGAINPAQIAIAITGEIIALENARRGGPLSDRKAPIHEPVAQKLLTPNSKVETGE